jgi:MFS family permease
MRPLHDGAREPSIAGLGRDRGAGAAEQARRPQPPRGSMPRRWGRRRRWGRWGSLPGRTGILMVIAGAVLGGVVTAATGNTPGLALGVFVIGATAAAVFAVRPRAVYLIIPAPALSYMLAATADGLIEIHGQASGAFLTTLAVTTAQWMSSGFLAMIVATGLGIVMTAARWPFGSPGPRDTGYGRPAARTGHPASRADRPPARASSPRHRVQRDTDDPATLASHAIPSPRIGT